ncbi:MAG: ABC transporter substrate-binding protein [Spirochaetota bacterium]
MCGLQGAATIYPAVEHINANGGIDGRAIELLIKDDMGEAPEARLADSELFNAGVEAIIGHTTSEMSAAGLSFCNEHELLLVSPTSSAEYLMGKDDYFFTLYPSNSRLARALAEFAYNELQIRETAALIDEANKLYTDNYYQEFKKYFERLGGRVESKYTYNSLNSNELHLLTGQLMSTDPESVLVLAASLDTALVAQQLFKRGVGISILGCDWAAYQELIEQGGPYVEHVFIPNLYFSSRHVSTYGELYEEYQKRFGETASVGAAIGYETMWLVAQALGMQAKNTSLKQTLLEGRFEGFEETISFDAYGEAHRKIYIKTIRNGEFVNAHE